MTFAEMIQKMTPDIYQALRRGVALGKWPNGVRLSEEQKAISMEAILRYEQEHQVPLTERVGYVAPKPPKTAPAEQVIRLPDTSH